MLHLMLVSLLTAPPPADFDERTAFFDLGLETLSRWPQPHAALPDPPHSSR